MSNKISVVINSLNSEDCIRRAIDSVKWADEIVVCDMHSDDATVEIAKTLGAKIVFHKRTNYVEPARNFAVSKASNHWVLVLDTDEEVPETLAKKLQEIAERKDVSFAEIPRKNMIFGKWMETSMWWPDYNIRFFKKGAVKWGDKIHRPPETQGEGIKLAVDERFAITHHHYITLAQFIERMNRYTSIQAQELVAEGYKFQWQDLMKKPLGEFLGRFFANRGFEDGLHGLALSLLQAFSFLVMYLKVWEMEMFAQQEIRLEDLKKVSQSSGRELNYWFRYGNLSSNPLKRFAQKVRNRF